jgi:hypothetical protein
MIAIVSHDAGGAEILSSYVRRNSIPCYFVLDGPAVKIFERKLGNIDIVSLDEAIQKSEWILCGSSSPAELELEAIEKGRLQGKRSVVFLDHWINYRERFIRNNREMLPDEIWVGDSAAEKIAKSIFCDIAISLVNNPYFDDIQQKINEFSHKTNREHDKLSLLFVSQPIRKHAKNTENPSLNRRYVEEDALRYFLANVGVLGRSVGEIIIRLHPAESSGKYDWAKEEFDLPIVVSSDGDLLEAILKSDIVVGMDSMAMIVGLLAERRVVCSIPLGGKPCRLPQSDIQLLSQLVGIID